MTSLMKFNNPEQTLFDHRGVPISSRFDDPYFSFQDGMAESEYVFLGGNDLPARLHDGFHIGELGFGTGLNFLLTWKAWRKAGISGRVYFTSFEAFPMETSAQARALSPFRELSDLTEAFLQNFDGMHFEADGISLHVIHGDAREQVPQWSRLADAWYLDGFSPAKNPELWDEALLGAVFEHTKPNGTFATYSAAGFVRNNLRKAGFEVERVKGFAHKRHMTRGRRLS